jgi:hypothetical protein
VSTPFYVITFNRVSGLENASRFTERSTLDLDLIILDMGSTYSPFWDYVAQKKLPFHSYSLPRGPRELWTQGHLARLDSEAFFISDGDIDYDNVDSNAFERMYEFGLKYPWFPKVGLALDINDLPDDEEGRRIRSWEKWNWKFEIEKDVFLGGLDTTIAFYPTRTKTFFYRPALRIAGKCTANHYPWLERTSNFSEEVHFYHSVVSSVVSTTASGTQKTFQTRAKLSILFQLFNLTRFVIKSRRFGPLMVKVLAFRGQFV